MILVVWPPMVAICIAGLVFFFEDPSPGGSGWVMFLVWLGHVSYGIYLWHFQVMRVLVLIYPDQWNTPAMSLLALAISFPTTLILAAVSYYIIEKPLMGWGKGAPRISAVHCQARSGRCAREGGRGHEAAWSVRLSGVAPFTLFHLLVGYHWQQMTSPAHRFNLRVNISASEDPAAVARSPQYSALETLTPWLPSGVCRDLY